MNGVLFFSANDGVNDIELWRSDGTAQGTYMVKDIYPGTNNGGYPNDSYPHELTVANGILFFSAYDGVNGTELWRSDGTAQGTYMVKDIYSGTSNSWPDELTDVNGVLFFCAYDGEHGHELWRSDGTSQGTVMVKDNSQASYDGYPHDLINVGGTMFFAANDGEYGVELWRRDGTAQGTYRITDICPGNNDSYLANLTYVNGTFFFTVSFGGDWDTLWKSDGTKDGTVCIRSNWPGSASSMPESLTNLNGALFFRAIDGENGEELWKSDGTSEGTFMVKDINPGTIDGYPNDSYPDELTDVNGTLFFRARDGENGDELWRSDGTPQGTSMVKDIMPGSDSYPYNLTEVSGILFFSANDGEHGDELWKSNGTQEGTSMIKDIKPGLYSSNPYNLTKVNGTLFFTAYDGKNGEGLWKSDGTPEGTVVVKEISLGGNLYTYNLTNVNGNLFFTADDGNNGAGLWKSDGTSEGTSLVKGLNPESTFIIIISSLTDVNGSLFFVMWDNIDGAALWKSDGTYEGTIIVKHFARLFGADIFQSDLNSWPLININSTLFFTADDGEHGQELWMSNGTEKGTVMIKDLYPGVEGSNIENMANVNGTLFFTANDGVHGQELWKLDMQDGVTPPKIKKIKVTGGRKLKQPDVTLCLTISGDADKYKVWEKGLSEPVNWEGLPEPDAEGRYCILLTLEPIQPGVKYFGKTRIIRIRVANEATRPSFKTVTVSLELPEVTKFKVNGNNKASAEGIVPVTFKVKGEAQTYYVSSDSQFSSIIANGEISDLTVSSKGGYIVPLINLSAVGSVTKGNSATKTLYLRVRNRVGYSKTAKAVVKIVTK